MLVNRTKKKTFLISTNLIFRVNSFQNKNTKRNFDLIIGDSRLYTSSMKIGTYQMAKKCSQKFNLSLRYITLPNVFAHMGK